MKKRRMLLSLLLVVIATLSSCGPSCKECNTVTMGMGVPMGELCGEDLKRAEAMSEVTCK